MKSKFFRRFNLWQWLTNFWSVVYFLTILTDWYTANRLTELLEGVAFIYVGLLAIYAGQKEFERWDHKHNGRHPGEVFVIMWTIIIILLVIFTVASRTGYKLPSAVISSYIAVLTILAITEKSKVLYHRRRKFHR